MICGEIRRMRKEDFESANFEAMRLAEYQGWMEGTNDVIQTGDHWYGISLAVICRRRDIVGRVRVTAGRRRGLEADCNQSRKAEKARARF
jgi:hypothetical protein